MELPERDREVLCYRIGLFGRELLTLEEVGKLLNLTRERVRQIQIDALKKLHGMLAEKGIGYDEALA
jgi:RNA polymerase nonessential primary-like sigma factor